MTDFLTNPKIAKLYQNVSEKHLAPYRKFRNGYTFKHITLNGIPWQYYDLGDGPETRLMLTGALGIPYFEWHHLLHFAQTHRIIAPCYPTVDTIDALCDGIAGILRHEGIEKAHVQGGSYGGFVAQIFVRKVPEMTTSLILSHTQPPYPDDEGMDKLEKMLRWLKLMPTALLRQFVRLSLRRLMPKKTPDNALMLAIYEELLRHHLTKATVLSTYNRVIDFEHRRFAPEDLVDWRGRILIMMTDDDRTTTEDVQKDLRTLYPQAQIHLFHGTGHATSWEQADAYQAVIDAFIKEASEKANYE